MFPPIPLWEGAHPIVVHLPIGLLSAAPVLVVLSLVVRRHAFGIGLSALVVMLLGTVGAFVAVQSGEAAAGVALRNDAINATLARHEELAETTQWIFAGLTALFWCVLILPKLVRRTLPAPAVITANIVFLALYVVGFSFLARTAHEGGVLVHHHGVQAMVSLDPADSASEHGAEHSDD